MAEQDKYTIVTPTVGLNTDSTITQIRPGELSYSLNATVESQDGQYVQYSNDMGNIACITFPEGYKVIGAKNITQINKVVYFLTSPDTGDSQIGYTDNESCNILLLYLISLLMMLMYLVLLGRS